MHVAINVLVYIAYMYILGAVKYTGGIRKRHQVSFILINLEAVQCCLTILYFLLSILCIIIQTLHIYNCRCIQF